MGVDLYHYILAYVATSCSAGKYGIFFTMFNIWIAAWNLRSGGGVWHISNPKPKEQIYEELKEYENEEVEEAT